MGMDRTDYSSCSKPTRGITSGRDWENVIYSISFVDKGISVWSLEHQIMGQLAYRITYPVRDMTDDDLLLQLVFYSPANDAST